MNILWQYPYPDWVFQSNSSTLLTYSDTLARKDLIRLGWDKYRAKPARRVFIPKANGKLRPLGIPTIKDRALQASTKLALEPFDEAKFESCRYGFRPGMGCHDAIEKIASVLLKKQKWILDADIKGCFDNIDHSYLAMQIDSEEKVFANKYPQKHFPLKHWIPIVKRWLKAGYIFDKQFNPTKMGTPQGSEAKVFASEPYRHY